MSARSAFATAQDNLTTAQAAYDAAQPHLSILAEIEAAAEKYGEEAKAEFVALVGRARSLF
jgi:hypothetical protein